MALYLVKDGRGMCSAGVRSGRKAVTNRYAPTKTGEPMRTDPNCLRPLMFAYTRVRTEEQADKRNGLEAKRAAIDAEAERRGWDVEHFADEAASGKNINANLREVLALLRSGQGDGMIVAKLDRLARSVVHAANIIEDAERGGWSLVVLDLNLDLTTAAGRMMARTVVNFAEYERE